MVPSGGTRPLEATSTALRSLIRAPISPTAAGSELQGTASTTRSTPANSISVTGLGSTALSSVTPGRYIAFSLASARRSAWAAVRQPS